MKILIMNTMIIISLIVASCSTPYQPKGLLGGYSEKQVNNNLYRVKFWGNQHTNPKTVENYLLYRCAEISQDNGYKYFSIIGGNKNNENFPGFTGGTRQSISKGGTPVGGTIGGGTRSFYTEYDFNYLIKLYNNKNIDNEYLFEAPKVIKKLSPFINL